MKIDTLKSTFVLMLAGIALGVFLSLNAFPPMLTLSLVHLFSIPFIVTAVVELNGSERIDKKEKTMWTFGFIALTFITAILYFASERRNVIPTKLS